MLDSVNPELITIKTFQFGLSMKQVGPIYWQSINRVLLPTEINDPIQPLVSCQFFSIASGVGNISNITLLQKAFKNPLYGPKETKLARDIHGSNYKTRYFLRSHE